MQAHSLPISRSLRMTVDQPTESTHTPVSPEQRFLDYARTGNKVIIQALIMEFADRSYNQARRIIGRRDGAEDAMQDAYMRLVNSAKKYDGSVPFAAWLGRLVSLAALNHRERRRSRHTNFSDMSDQGAIVMNKQVSAEDCADAPELEALRTALDSLPDRYRNPMTMHYFGGLDHNETAAALGIPARTIETQIGRGLERLREKLCRAGFALTSAGLLTVFASVPTYAAPPVLKASMAAVASERLVFVGRHFSQRLLSAKGLTSGKAVGLAIAALVAGAVLVFSRHNAPVPQMTQVPSDAGLIAHWSFDEGQGTTVKNKAGSDFGALVGGPGWSKGENGGRLSFDGIDDHVRVEHQHIYNSIPLTISFRFMVINRTENYPVLIQKMERWDTNGWSFHLGNGDKTGLDWEVVKDSASYRATSKTKIQVNTMYAVVGTYSEGVLKLYLNGILEATAAGVMGLTGDPIYMGCEDGNIPGDIPRIIPHMLNGCLEDVRIHNRVLSDSEMTSLSADVGSMAPGGK
jgi:RNA polymerase sigma-70 factor (ECF subfamily)